MGDGRKQKLSVAVERAVADETALVLDTFGGKLHVKFDHATSVTMLGQLLFLLNSCKPAGSMIAGSHRFLLCTARRTRRAFKTCWARCFSPRSPGCGMRRYRHINALRADGVSPGLLGMTKIVSDDSLTRTLGAMDEAVADQCQFGLRARGAGSVRVRAGANVGVGDWLGSVGNSDNTGEPHLHVHAQRQGSAEAALGGDPRPIQFNGRFPVRGDRIEAP